MFSLLTFSHKNESCFRRKQKSNSTYVNIIRQSMKIELKIITWKDTIGSCWFVTPLSTNTKAGNTDTTRGTAQTEAAVGVPRTQVIVTTA